METREIKKQQQLQPIEKRSAYPEHIVVSDPNGNGPKRGPNPERPTDVNPKAAPIPKVVPPPSK